MGFLLKRDILTKNVIKAEGVAPDEPVWTAQANPG